MREWLIRRRTRGLYMPSSPEQVPSMMAQDPPTADSTTQRQAFGGKRKHRGQWK
jgi:hypothetical protein